MSNKLAFQSVLISAVVAVMALASSTAAQARSWTGGYAGIHLGGALSDLGGGTVVGRNGAYFITTDPAQIRDAGRHEYSGSAFAGGLHAGHNWQVERFVIGFEADANWLRFRSSERANVEYLSFPGTRFDISSSAAIDWLVTLRPRIGYTAGPVLFYATAGIAISNVKYSYRFSDTAYAARETASASRKIGWTAGGGVEASLNKSWSLKAEYLFVDLGGASASGSVSNNGGFTPRGTLGPVEYQHARAGLPKLSLVPGARTQDMLAYSRTVKLQEVVPVEPESADRGCFVYPHMRSMPIIAVFPDW